MKKNDRMPNHLNGQLSPYLLQHLYNPVDWYPWGEDALKRAVNEDKPILVSIGYSACHWCHVMEKESFEDAEIAEIMNREFICIKVDREERPDIDHMYMSAVQLMTRQGGWPLNCFALPDTRPFWGGTYFPADQWKSILRQVSDIYKKQRKDLIEQAEKLTRGIADSNFISSAKTGSAFDEQDTRRFFNSLMEHMDKTGGGTVNAPKFPVPVNIEFLLNYYYHTGEVSAIDQAEVSLRKMAMGGIYDQAGGGFSRYSTDELWKVPHFEKMLYDNGQLVSVYSRAYSLLKTPLFKNVVYQTIDFIERELTSPDGIFYSALDADSEGEEGKFYVWKESEIDLVLGNDAPVIKDYYQVGKQGYWENGNNILLRIESDEDFSRKWEMSIEDLRSLISRSNQKLLESRSQRVRPGLDNKTIASWNALMISGLTEAYAAFGEASYLIKAKRAADFIIRHSVTDEGKIFRTISGKEPLIDGFLEDYALFIKSLLNLFEVTQESGYLNCARRLTEFVINNFTSENTRLFPFSSNNGEKLKAEFYEIHDNVIPSSNSVMAMNLFYMSGYFEEMDWARRASGMTGDIGSQMFRYSPGFSNWARLMLHHVYPFYIFVVCGTEAEQSIKEVKKNFLPGTAIAGTRGKNSEIPVFRNRCKDYETWYYVCSMGQCRLPVKNIEEALSQIIPNNNL
ncbi:MAG: thioredoxin domain-containing protein [Bacteroidales bacterium]